MVSHLFFPCELVAQIGLPAYHVLRIFGYLALTKRQSTLKTPGPGHVWMALWFDSLRNGKIGQNMSSQLECSDWPTQIKHHDVNLIQCINRVCLSQPVDLGFPASWKAARIFGCSFDQQISGSARRNGRLRGWEGDGFGKKLKSIHALTISNPCNFHSFYMTTSWEGLAIVWSQLVGSCLFVCLSVFFFLSLSLSPPLSLLIQFTPWLEFVWRSDLWRRLITTIAGAGLLFMHPLASVAARKNGWGSGLTCTKSPLLCSLHQKTLFCLGAFIGALWAVSLWSRSTHPHPASAWRLECKVARPDQESTVDPCNAISCVWPACLQCVCIVCGCFDAVCLLQALVESLEEDAETEVLQSLLLLPQSQSDLFDAIGVQWSTTVQRAFDCLLIDKAVERHPVS